MKISIIGAGNMGGAVARGIASLGDKRIVLNVSNPSQDKLTRLKADYPEISTFSDNTECIKGADMVILAVKPWIIRDVIEEIRLHIPSSGMVLISVAAGISPDDIDNMTLIKDSALPIYQVIPNTAAAYGSSMTFATGIRTTPDTDRMVAEVFDSIGVTRFVNPKQLEAGMAVASCGIAFMFRFMRAMAEGGVELGLRPHEALEAVAQTMRGAADIIQRGGGHPESEVDKVTTAGGITIRGLNAMEENGLSGAIIKGLRACTK